MAASFSKQHCSNKKYFSLASADLALHAHNPIAIIVTSLEGKTVQC
jgi:hypothetical protein